MTTPDNNQGVFTNVMENNEKSKHEGQLHQSKHPRLKKHYEAPKITVLKLDRAKAELVARAVAGDRAAEDLLETYTKA